MKAQSIADTTSKAEVATKEHRGAAASIVGFLLACLLGFTATQGHAYPYPPVWGTGTVNEGTSPLTTDAAHGGPIHFAPAAWPTVPTYPADCGTTCGDW